MNIDIKDTITLDDNNNYVVVSKADYENNTYYYLIDKENNENVKFCVENKNSENSIIEVIDENLIQKLLPLFVDNGKSHIDLEEKN